MRQHLSQGDEATTDSPATDQDSNSSDEGDATEEDGGEGGVPTLTPRQQTELNFYYFNRGFKAEEMASNFTNCAERTINWAYHEKVTYEVKLLYGTGFENALNTTLFI